jgi:hypothetical protein
MNPVGQNPHFFECKNCNYITRNLKDYKKHTQTMKHNKLVSTCSSNKNTEFSNSTNVYSCSCGNNYKHMSSLCKHKKKCNNMNNETIIQEEKKFDKEFVLALFKSNQEFQKSIFEFLKDNTNNVTNTTNNSTNINSNNKTFNLQVYLNETCKNAMNLSEFVDMIVPTIEDLEKTGRDGYVKGISNIVQTRLDKVNKNNQPIHCTDGKREILYIKENNVWNKETEDKPLLTKAIKTITHKNMCNIIEWQKLYPDCTNSDSRKNDLYLKIVSNSMPGCTQEESNENYAKIISNVVKNTIIDKIVSY